MNISTDNEKVTVVITSYNHGHYILTAINSVKAQTYKPIEVIVVDDGSTDDTENIVCGIDGVIYFKQDNKGLSAARNSGLKLSTGSFITFLDADDWLYPQAIEKNVQKLNNFPNAVFAAGAYDLVSNDGSIIYEFKPKYKDDAYLHLLEGNFIAMHSTVLFRKDCFGDGLQYDTSLRACEDYDIYFKITRSNPVILHDDKISAYRRHSENMSNNTPLMVSQSLKVLNRQKKFLRNELERKNWHAGRDNWIMFYLEKLYFERFSKIGYFKLNADERKLIRTYLGKFVRIWGKDLLSGKK